MELQKAINILETHNHRRRGELNEMGYAVKELGEAIDMILKEVVEIEVNKSCTHAYTIIHENKVFSSDYFDEENLFVKGHIPFIKGKNHKKEHSMADPIFAYADSVFFLHLHKVSECEK